MENLSGSVGVFMAIGAVIGVLILCRQLVIWWTGINEVIEGLKAVVRLLKEQNELIKNNNSPKEVEL